MLEEVASGLGKGDPLEGNFLLPDFNRRVDRLQDGPVIWLEAPERFCVSNSIMVAD